MITTYTKKSVLILILSSVRKAKSQRPATDRHRYVCSRLQSTDLDLRRGGFFTAYGVFSSFIHYCTYTHIGPSLPHLCVWRIGVSLKWQIVRTITILFHTPCGPIYANLSAPHSLSIIGSDEANESDITLILKWILLANSVHSIRWRTFAASWRWKDIGKIDYWWK